MDADQYNGKLSGPWVSFTTHDQACIEAPTLLIKYPQTGLVFEQGCVLSCHYWHVFNNSWDGATEESAWGLCNFATEFVKNQNHFMPW